MMRWKKLGRIYDPDSMRCGSWHASHAANTVALQLGQGLFRIFFSARDELRRSHITYLDIRLSPDVEVISLSPQPVLSPGTIGLFDDSGASLSAIIPWNGKYAIYYLGWNLGVTVPWRNSIGMAILESEGRAVRVSPAPILDRNDKDPYSVSYPFVLKDGKIYRMWYGSNLSWGPKQEDMAHVIKYAESDDAIHWRPTGIVSVDLKNEYEYALSRPCVIKEDGIYKMWYSYRAGPTVSTYRIGYAQSADGVRFERMDEIVGIDVSPDPSDWDSEMICYPFIFDYRGNRYMLYNGNGYGRTGFGLAVLENG
ncbi:MAG: hypothetical protein RMM53_04475 [Bacteroidia bacterium]|nr:hypothetical protein [Bacteroidia bacterium]MDW8333454.1 hypothetical protein [Bacteroidia bacterium]